MKGNYCGKHRCKLGTKLDRQQMHLPNANQSPQARAVGLSLFLSLCQITDIARDTFTSDPPHGSSVCFRVNIFGTKSPSQCL